MSLMRRVRLGSSSGARASASAPQTGSVTPQTSTLSLQASGSHAGDSAEESTALSRMKTAAGLALDVIQKGLRLSAEATSDVGIPGLSIGLSALAEILEMVQTMKTTINGVQELHEHVVSLVSALDAFRSLSQGSSQSLPPHMSERMHKLETKWTRIGERAKKIKSHGKLKRFFTSTADAKALQSLVDEVNNSIQDDLIEGIRNIERDVNQIRRGVDAVLEDVGDVQNDVGILGTNVEVVGEQVGEVLVGVDAVLDDLGDVGQNVEGVREELAVVQEDVDVIGENVRAVRQGVQGVGENVEAVWGGLAAVGAEVQAVRDDIGPIRHMANVIMEANFLAPYAKMAPYNANEVRRSCLEGTRVEFLQEVYAWITNACRDGTTTVDNRILLWINGMGGTGKTTVAHSAAGWCDGKGLLGGSFFCSRVDADCSNPSLVFPSLCRQLCAHHRPFKDEVEKVLQATPDVASHGLFRQFEELIVRPLEKLDSPFPRSVFVLDALDELKDKGAKWTILSVIAKFVARLAKFLLFIVTSRPEERITALFEASRKDSLGNITKPLLMHDIPLDVALKDLRLYVDHEFDDYVGILSIKPGWPSAEQKDTLVRQSRGLFIYIVTAIKFIMDEAYRDPEGQIDSLTISAANSSTPHEFLAELYSKILVASYEKMSAKLAARLRDVLSAVVLAQEPLTPSSIAHMVGLKVADVRNTLTGLHSVLHISADDHQPIRIIHPTFPEFLLQSPETTSLGPSDLAPIVSPLRLRPATQHWFLLSRCIITMSGALKRDMIGMRYPAMFLSEVENLEEKVNTAIKPHLSYACRFWGFHLREGAEDATTLDIFVVYEEFIRKKLLYWIETCSLLDAMDRVASALHAAHNVCETLGGRFSDLVPLLSDSWRFALAYSPCIHTAPLQIYHCALSICPTNGPVGITYGNERRHALLVDHGTSASWDPCIHAFVGHGGNWVYGIAFSADGSCFVTGGVDNKATVWKTATRTPIVSFDGHTNFVNCVAYAPDGQHVASGSHDSRVCVWQPSSGECVHALEGHTGQVYSVAYSGDGRRIVSANDGGEVKLWDTTDGRCLLTLDKTGNYTWQVGISPDGGVIARGDGASLSLYDVASSSSEALEFSDWVEACVFSPDGRYIAARSERVIRVWARADKSIIRSIEVAEDLTSRLAFSPDGTLIGCGSRDGSVRLWPIVSEDSPHTLQGHTDWVRDLAYSPDKSQAISVADDGMVRVWDLASSSTITEEQPALNPVPPATGPPRFALVQSGEHAIALLDLSALGIDAERFLIGAQMPVTAPTATLFSDIVGAWDAALQAAEKWDTAREWERLTGQRHSQLSQRPLAISPDSALMAYVSPTSDSVIDVCNLRTGTVIATLTGHTHKVRSIAFSPDTTRIATGSNDRSVKVWDTTTGALLCGHTEHKDTWWTRAVAFSLDGCLVASGSNDQTIRIFELATERVIRVLDSHRAFVAQVMFAADNTHLVALDDSHRVYVWDVTTGVRTHEFSLEDDSWLRSPLFSPDGTGITVRDDHGVSRSVSLWNPGRRTWPVYWLTQDGWVYAMRPGKTHRLCWLPPEWREALASYEGTFCIREANSELYKEGRVIVLNMTQLVEYVDSLDP